MSIMTEVRKWLPLTLITVATLVAVMLTHEYVTRPAPMADPMREFGE